MKKNRAEQSDELMALLIKVRQNTNSVDKADIKRMKKLINDPTLLVEAMQKLDPDFSVPSFPAGDDSRTLEEIISDNYVALAKFAIEKMQLKDAHKLKVEELDGGFTIYALTPEPVELCFEQFATSDYPYYKELLLEAEALESDLAMDDNDRKYRLEIVNRIESAVM